eukprot:765104-Hanusia_phi.AAC.15
MCSRWLQERGAFPVVGPFSLPLLLAPCRSPSLVLSLSSAQILVAGPVQVPGGDGEASERRGEERRGGLGSSRRLVQMSERMEEDKTRVADAEVRREWKRRGSERLLQTKLRRVSERIKKQVRKTTGRAEMAVTESRWRRRWRRCEVCRTPSWARWRRRARARGRVEKLEEGDGASALAPVSLDLQDVRAQLDATRAALKVVEPAGCSELLPQQEIASKCEASASKEEKGRLANCSLHLLLLPSSTTTSFSPPPPLSHTPPLLLLLHSSSSYYSSPPPSPTTPTPPPPPPQFSSSSPTPTPHSPPHPLRPRLAEQVAVTRRELDQLKAKVPGGTGGTRQGQGRGERGDAAVADETRRAWEAEDSSSESGGEEIQRLKAVRARGVREEKEAVKKLSGRRSASPAWRKRETPSESDEQEYRRPSSAMRYWRFPAGAQLC